jgi:CRISPR-associated endonuclease/helicase Cas3
VYADGRVLQRTLDVLREQPEVELPRDNRRLIEQTTHPESFVQLSEAWRRHGQEVEGQVIAMSRAALTGTLDDRPFGELQYRSPDERLTTRLGAANLDLTLAHPMSQPFGTLVRSVGIPEHMARGLQSLPERIEATPRMEGFSFALGDRRYRYTRYGLEFDEDA